MDLLGERIARLETALPLETQLLGSRMDRLEDRIERMESSCHPSRPGPEGGQVGSLGKLLLAICLPLIVLLATGDPHKAAALATKLVGG